MLWPRILNRTNVWFLLKPQKLEPTKIKPSTVCNFSYSRLNRHIWRTCKTLNKVKNGLDLDPLTCQAIAIIFMLMFIWDQVQSLWGKAFSSYMLHKFGGIPTYCPTDMCTSFFEDGIEGGGHKFMFSHKPLKNICVTEGSIHNEWLSIIVWHNIDGKVGRAKAVASRNIKHRHYT